LLNQGAEDISRYDFIRDIVRVESVVRDHPDTTGFVLALTNESLYWRVPTAGRDTADGAFRLHEGATLSGTLGWRPGTGAGTTKGREKDHGLTGSYELHWRDYSRVADGPAGTFRYRLLEVG
jgi:hypothetical protein